jgi:hypothetical protein
MAGIVSIFERDFITWRTSAAKKRSANKVSMPMMYASPLRLSTSIEARQCAVAEDDASPLMQYFRSFEGCILQGTQPETLPGLWMGDRSRRFRRMGEEDLLECGCNFGGLRRWP